MTIKWAVLIAFVSLAVIFCILQLLPNEIDSDNRTTGDQSQIDWTQKAREIAAGDPEFKALAGNNQTMISGVVLEGSYGYLYFLIEDKIYNVSVSFKNDRVTSIKEEKDEKTLEWLKNISISVNAIGTEK